MKVCQERKLEISYFESKCLPLKCKKVHSLVFQISETISYLKTDMKTLAFFAID